MRFLPLLKTNNKFFLTIFQSSNVIPDIIKIVLLYYCPQSISDNKEPKEAESD